MPARKRRRLLVTQMPPNASYGMRQWTASVDRPAIANLSRPPFLISDRKTAAPSRQTPRLDFPDQFQHRLSQAAA
jgi:hypothetical protein